MLHVGTAEGRSSRWHSDYCCVYIPKEFIVRFVHSVVLMVEISCRHWHQRTGWNTHWNRKWAKATHRVLHLCAMPPPLQVMECLSAMNSIISGKKGTMWPRTSLSIITLTRGERTNEEPGGEMKGMFVDTAKNKKMFGVTQKGGKWRGSDGGRGSSLRPLTLLAGAAIRQQQLQVTVFSILLL